MADLPSSPEKHYLGSTLPADRETLLTALEATKSIQKRWPGAKVFLDAETDFQRRFDAIAARYGIDPPDVIIVKSPLDKHGKPKPQKPDAGVGWDVIDGKFHNVVFVTEYLKSGLNDPELLAALAHEMGHVSQYQKNGHNPHKGGKAMEGDADKLALACPEVDPATYKAMLLKVDKLTDAVAKQHPLLYGDITGSTAIVPVSLQTKLAFGGNHPMTSTRVKWAEEEIAQRSASMPSGRATPREPGKDFPDEQDILRAQAQACAANLVKQPEQRLVMTEMKGHDPVAAVPASCALDVARQTR